MIEFEYKIGDIVYCYKDNKYDGTYIHKKGNYYEIKEIDEYFSNARVTLLYEKGNELYQAYWISPNLNKGDQILPGLLFYDYFLSKQECRKIKLKKLNEKK